MIWGGISRGGRINLKVLQRGTKTGVRYRDDILDVFLRPYAGAIGQDFILMDGNAQPHRARVVDAYLEQDNIVCMEWSARSPYLNPIEHVWNELQITLSRRTALTAALQELSNALTEE